MPLHAAETALLSELFDEVAIAPLIDPHHSVVLKESGIDAKLKKLTISHLDPDALVIILEKGQTKDHRYTPMFSMATGWTHHKACDAVVFLKYRGEGYVVYIELKSGTTKGCEAQFEAAEHFIAYAFTVLGWQKKHTPMVRHHRRVVFNTAKTICQTLPKLPINPRKAVKHHITFIRVQNNDVVTPKDFC